MSECKHECVILKRICIFFLGLAIGCAAGYMYGIAECKERVQNRMKQNAEKPTLPKYQKMQRDRREKMRERKEKVSE